MNDYTNEIKEIRLTVAGLAQLQSQMFLDGIAAIVQPVKTHYLWRPIESPRVYRRLYFLRG